MEKIALGKNFLRWGGFKPEEIEDGVEHLRFTLSFQIADDEFIILGKIE